MSAFRWEAVDARGRVSQGVLEAASARAARDQLRAGGLTPTAVAEAAARTDSLQHTRLPAPLVTLTTRQLATLVQSGMPLDLALAAVAEQADDARAAKIVAAVRTQLASGEALPAALARYPRTFSPLYRGLVGAGAETGRLAEVLARLADYLEAREALRQKVVLALIYPAIVTVIAFAVIAILVGSGAPLLRSLDAASDVVRMLPLSRAARAATALVREGVTLSRALKEQAAFPPVLVHLVANGESSGRLGPMLQRAAEELERDAERRLAWLAALLQPALIVVMGAIVLVLVLAVMLPIVSMNQLIR